MRFLILSAILAYANAGLLPALAPAPLVYAAAPNHGDLQAAAINANVAASDYARAASDSYKENAEAAIRHDSEAYRAAVDQGREFAGESFWRSQDAGWQALSAAQSHQSAVDGVISGASASHAAHLAYAAPAAYAHGYAAAPLAYAGYPAPLAHGYAAPLAYAAPAIHAW